MSSPRDFFLSWTGLPRHGAASSKAGHPAGQAVVLRQRARGTAAGAGQQVLFERRALSSKFGRLNPFRWAAPTYNKSLQPTSHSSLRSSRAAAELQRWASI
jgi:hypothetical protein